MSIKYLLKDFILPKGITINKPETKENLVVFEVQPFERGFATTVGNLFRRVLLSSIQGYAVSAVRFNIGNHLLTSEYESIEGVVEDSIDIIENIKNLKFIINQENPDNHRKVIVGQFNGTGPCKGDIFDHPDITLLNGDTVLFNATEDNEIVIEIEVELGRGFVPSEITEKRIDEIGTITVDAIFSPVVNVTHSTEGIRIGHRSDYEKLILSVETDGTTSPVEVVAQAAKIVKEHMTEFINFNEDDVDVISESESKLLEMKKLLDLSIDELELSSRSYNCLKAANIVHIRELVQLTDKEIQALPNFGNKSMDEIQTKLAELNFSLGMQLPPEVLM